MTCALNAVNQKKSPSQMNNNSVEEFLKASTFAVAGASNDRAKYGNKVFCALVASGRTVFPLNPTAHEVEGHTAYPSIADLPVVPEALSIVTPPKVTRNVVQQAIVAGVKHIWMQPGAEDDQACQAAREAGLDVIDDGSCVLVSLAIERPSR
jgi:predicted CoA-binding protein